MMHGQKNIKLFEQEQDK